ncbi:hypothetical protein Syun_017031 [Stephania yunnanensis]|uniref:Uncharacterized protein n=1 Tax=Stephania yunnanensis TaxID=152371 RepID=A0AAP0J668_9MAGN
MERLPHLAATNCDEERRTSRRLHSQRRQRAKQRQRANPAAVNNEHGDQLARGDGCRASDEEQRPAVGTAQAAVAEGPSSGKGFRRSDEQPRPAAVPAQAATAEGDVDGDGFRGSGDSRRRRLQRRRGQTTPPPADEMTTCSDDRQCSDLWVLERVFGSGDRGRRELTVGWF